MKSHLYLRRIAFMIGDQHLVPHGGVGQFAKGIIEIAQTLNWKVDIISDKPPTKKTGEFHEVLKSLGASFVYPKTPISYKDHANVFAFSDSMNFEKMVNFRNSIMGAFEKNIYDAIICNTLETFPVAYGLNLHPYIPVIFYTHNESMIFRESRTLKNVFSESFNQFFNQVVGCAGVVVGTQSERNAQELVKNVHGRCVHLQMPIPETALLAPNFNEREGVLFIGRWEKGKNPEEYLRVIKETGLPAKILTNSNGARKFRDWFKEHNITNYTIGESLIGQEKVEFITSARLHLNTSLRESYGFAMFECIGHMPCVVLEGADWRNNFNSLFYRTATKSSLVSVVDDLYHRYASPNLWYASGSLEYVRSLHSSAGPAWNGLISNYKSKESLNTSAKINTYDSVTYSEYIAGLGRSQISIEDVQSVLSNRSKFNVRYSDGDTYLYRGDAPMLLDTTAGSTSLEELFA